MEVTNFKTFFLNGMSSFFKRFTQFTLNLKRKATAYFIRRSIKHSVHILFHLIFVPDFYSQFTDEETEEVRG